jgi:hypothetical protein
VIYLINEEGTPGRIIEAETPDQAIEVYFHRHVVPTVLPGKEIELALNLKELNL